MICLGCLKDVPDLVGPEESLCPDCYGLVSEDLIPSLLAGWAESEGAKHEAFLQEFSEDFLETEELEDPCEYSACAGNLDAAPTFQGRPRF
jgi:hypothetical protein